MPKLCKVCNLQPRYREQGKCLACNNVRRKELYRLNPEPHKLSSRKHRANRKIKTIQAYGGKCSCCAESNLKLLSIDHIDGGGNEHRRKIVGLNRSFYTWLQQQNYPEGFRVLCYNCNLGRAFNYEGGHVCPHKENNA